MLSFIIINGCTQQVPQPTLPTQQPPPPQPGNIQQEIECYQDSDCEQGTCNDGTSYKKYSCTNNECVLLRYVKDPCQKDMPIINYYVGNEVIVDGEKLVLKSISQDGEIVLLRQDGKEISIKGTQSFTKLNSKEIVITKLNLPTDPADRYVVLEVRDFILGPNEYVLEYNRDVSVFDKKVRLTDVYYDKLESIQIKVIKGLQSETLRINKGKTKQELGLKITNIRSNPRPISYEKYAIVKIEQA